MGKKWKYSKLSMFVEDIFESLRSIEQDDPITFWLSLYSAATGSVALFLSLSRLFRL